MTYTKGPWEINNPQHRRKLIMASNVDHGCVAEVFEHSSGDEPETVEANAHLIASAPDLLRAVEYLLENAVYNTEHGNDSVNAIKAAKQVVAKAKGETND